MPVLDRHVAALLRRGRRDLKAGKHADALATLTAAVDANPKSASAHYHLARAHFYLGEIERATSALRRALRGGAHFKALEFLATIAAFDPALDHAAVLRCRQALYTAIRKRCGTIRRPRLEVSGRRILKIGYVSSFFQDENWMKPVWGLIDHHDRRRVEIHLFSDAPRSAVGRRFTSRRDRFHDISKHDNSRAARLIASQRIDVLVDLNGYSARRRLPLFVLKPAPVVAAWFNVFGTTGMPCFDAVIGDEWVIREHEERWYVEEVFRLPVSNQTFQVDYAVPDVQPPPCLRQGFVTFGCLTSLYKLNRETLSAWAAILRRCRRSRLIVGSALLESEGNRAHTLRRFSDLGVPADRITLRGPAPHQEFLRNYDSIDIALDTFPYGGGTTTIEAIWQGVPVLTSDGDRWVARQGVSILTNAGLDQFIHQDVAAYVEAAVRWGNAPDTPAKLSALRRTMRARVGRSSICQCSGLARAVEDVYSTLLNRL